MSGPARFAWRCVAAHTATYIVAGGLALVLMDYERWWGTEYMSHYRPMSSPWVAMGPALQWIRGLVLAGALYPFRAIFLEQPRGWLKLWALLVGLGILSTYGASPSSVEGVIYTRLPPIYHLFGLPEVLGQSLAFSLCLVGWHRRPHRAWGLTLGGLTALSVVTGLAGVFLAP